MYLLPSSFVFGRTIYSIYIYISCLTSSYFFFISSYLFDDEDEMTDEDEEEMDESLITDYFFDTEFECY